MSTLHKDLGMLGTRGNLPPRCSSPSSASKRLTVLKRSPWPYINLPGTVCAQSRPVSRSKKRGASDCAQPPDWHFLRLLCFGVSDLGVQQPDPQFGRDQPQRVGDVGGAEIDVIGARQSMLEDRLLEAVLVVRSALRQGEVAVHDEAGRTFYLIKSTR
jgi:hypothetical protein